MKLKNIKEGMPYEVKSDIPYCTNLSKGDIVRVKSIHPNGSLTVLDDGLSHAWWLQPKDIRKIKGYNYET